MKVSSFLVTSILITASSSSHASPGDWMPEAKKISEIIVEGGDGGQALILIEGGVPSTYIPSGCNSTGESVYNVVFLNTDKGRSIYSLALAAYMSGKPVRLAVNCTGVRPLITHIRF